MQELSGVNGCKEWGWRDNKELVESGGSNLETSSETVKLENVRGNWNF